MIEVGSYSCSLVESPLPSSKTNVSCGRLLVLLRLRDRRDELGRGAGASEAATFVTALQGSASDETVLTAILASAEYFAYAPSVPGVGGARPRTPPSSTPSRAAPRSRRLASGSAVLRSHDRRIGRDGVVTAILASTEWRSRVVSAYYTTLLGRAGSAGEVSAMVGVWSGWRAMRLAFEAGAAVYANAASPPPPFPAGPPPARLAPALRGGGAGGPR